MDYQLLIRDYDKVKELIKGEKDSYSQLINFKCEQLSELSDTQPFLPDNTLNNQHFVDQYQVENLYVMDIESTKYSLLNFMRDDNQITKQVFENELTYPTFQPYLIQLSKLPKQDFQRKVGWLEVIYKLIQSPKQKKSMKFQTYNELIMWQKAFIEVAKDITNNQEYFLILRKPLKELFRLCLIQILSILDRNIYKYFEQLNSLINNDLMQIFQDSQLRITIIYSLAKIVFPKLDSNEKLPEEHIKILSILISHDKINKIPNFESWLQFFEFLLFFMLSEINLKKEHIFQKNLEDKIKKEHPDIPFIDQLWYYVAVNFTQQNIKLNQSLKKLISHNVYSLINIYCVRYNKYQLMNQILEDLLITPFEDDVLRMNMCIILFNTDDYNKLHQMIQSLLASEQIKDHEFRPVIISMCVMFTGIYLGKGEEALCFARMNYNDYDKGIITLDTLLAQIGYCFYNLGKSAKYVFEKEHFYIKALEYYQKSIEQNSDNHLVQYNYGKLLAITGDIKKAFCHVDQACRLCGAEINFKILRALLYQTQHENQTALQIISSLLIIKQSPLLYFIKASVLTEIYLLNLFNEKELQYAQNISEELKQFVIKKFQKSKEVQSILQNLKKFLLGVSKKMYEFDQNDQFIFQLPPLKSMQNFDIDPLTYINYRNCIFNTIDILIKLQIFDLANQVLELVDDGNESNDNEKLFYQGLLEEKKDKIDVACHYYEEVLRTDFYHVRAMSRLGLLYLKHYKDSKIQRASELLIAASKFEKTYEICLGLGILNQLQNNNSEAQKFLNDALRLLKTSPIVSFQMIPDILFG
ncbi:unnamed protein product [Paramecium pentaurelia]|uniref:Tetratricopeptide repeat protein n=1 Tax=Paramecium pentaurelia TaxID=43138 RepID=A0A8S1SLI2_9CILI|nr:unnamed protein product [Paramecium pentaurelia]